MTYVAPSQDIQHMLKLAQDAGKAIMRIYATQLAVAEKADRSPVTEADIEAEKIIVRGLAEHWPKIPIVAEELSSRGEAPEVDAAFFLVDPLDGTKEFISRNGEFTVNIALIENGKPVLGVVYAPAINRIYWGDTKTGTASASALAITDDLASVTWQRCHTRATPLKGATAVASRSHRDAETEQFLKAQKIEHIIAAGSSLKFCQLAEGLADVYPRFGRTMEWDIAAGQAVLVAAGGSVSTVDGKPMKYGKPKFENPAFIARGA
jgi:3'(2'), 5'-bisphosphate nucleotidase